MSETSETLLFLSVNIDIPPTVPIAASGMKILQQHLPAILLLTLSIICLTPTLTHADQQTQAETITIDASGQATPIGSGPSGATSLNLTADAYKNANGWLMIQNTTGILQIGSTTLQITGGHGSVSKVGAVAIFGDTTTGKGQLILQGTMTGNTVMFGTPSQLATESYLTLSGNVNNNTEQAAASTTSVTSAPNTIGNVTTSTSSLNVTQHTNSTTTLPSSTLQNTTTQVTSASLASSSSTTSENVTTAAITNSTVSSAAASSSVIANATTSNNSGTGQHSVTIHVVQGQGEICLNSRELMPVCTKESDTVSVNAGDMININSMADIGFAWDHYDGLGIGQAQNFNAIITQDIVTGVYFMPMSASTANVTTAVSIPTVSVTTTSSSGDSPTTTLGSITMPVQGNVTVTVTQYVNQTVSVTQTVAYSTMTYTVTSTVANTTITRGNATAVVNATTTVSTTTTP